MTLTMWVTMAVVVILAVTVVGHGVLYRDQLSEMNGMMCSMAIGMMIGLLAGTVLGAILGGHLLTSTVVGMLIGLGAGFISGWPMGILATLDGMLSGLMGGMMGAMIGEMLPLSQAETLVRILFVIYVGITILLIHMMKRHVGNEGRLFARPFTMVIFLALFFMGYNSLGPLGLDEAVAQGHGGGSHSHHSMESMDSMKMDSMKVSKDIMVTATEFTYSPAVIEAQQGKAIKITLRNAGNVEHDLEVQGLPGGKVHVHAKPGMSESVVFTPKQEGTYKFYCTVPGHKEAGMVGKLVVR